MGCRYMWGCVCIVMKESECVRVCKPVCMIIFHSMFRLSSAPITEDLINLPAIKFVN